MYRLNLNKVKFHLKTPLVLPVLLPFPKNKRIHPFEVDLGVPKGRLFQFTIGSHSDQYETQNFTVQENWLVQFDLAGLKSVPCARLFAAFLKIGFVLFKMK